MDEEKRRPGRPRTRDEASSRRVYIGFAVPTPLKAALENAAEANRRSLSSEATSRLERSFDAPLPHDDLREAMALLWIKREGRAALVRFLISVDGDPDEEEQTRRRAQIIHAATPPRSEWLEPDKPTEAPVTPTFEEAPDAELTPKAKAILGMPDNPTPEDVERYMKTRRR
jgi:hypothetical protein